MHVSIHCVRIYFTLMKDQILKVQLQKEGQTGGPLKAIPGTKIACT